jgi:hydroxymethylpyrimidine pyrophosphatase-like HAD family hydrolase
MRYRALATDYDGTLAHDGRTADSTLAALERLRDSGRKLILVTGRELEELRIVFPHFRVFDRIVAENGALIFRPDTGHIRLLCEPPPDRFIVDLQRRGVAPLSVGRTIVATVEPHQNEVLASIHALGLEWHLAFNKGAVMALPSGITKATGLMPALMDLEIRPEQVVGIGDAENDHAFLSQCGCAVAVANALRSVKERCDWVTQASDGAGIEELISRILTDDLAGLGRAVST